MCAAALGGADRQNGCLNLDSSFSILVAVIWMLGVSVDW